MCVFELKHKQLQTITMPSTQMDLCLSTRHLDICVCISNRQRIYAALEIQNLCHFKLVHIFSGHGVANAVMENKDGNSAKPVNLLVCLAKKKKTNGNLSFFLLSWIQLLYLLCKANLHILELMHIFCITFLMSFWEITKKKHSSVIKHAIL